MHEAYKACKIELFTYIGSFIILNLSPAIAAHFSASVVLAYFIFENWSCELFWYVFAGCNCIPALTEIVVIIGVMACNKGLWFLISNQFSVLHVTFQRNNGLYIPKAYTSLGTSLMQILLLSAHACMHFAWELQLDTQCVHLVYALVANCNQNAYMHEQPTKEFGVCVVTGSA